MRTRFLKLKYQESVKSFKYAVKDILFKPLCEWNSFPTLKNMITWILKPRCQQLYDNTYIISATAEMTGWLANVHFQICASNIRDVSIQTENWLLVACTELEI